jgi:hypothetical protein
MCSILRSFETQGIAKRVGEGWRLTECGWAAPGGPLLSAGPEQSSDATGTVWAKEPPSLTMLAPTLTADREAA